MARRLTEARIAACSKGGLTRADKLTGEQRRAIAAKAEREQQRKVRDLILAATPDLMAAAASELEAEPGEEIGSL